MNTLNGYSKSTLTDNYLLSAGGGHIPLGNASGNVPLNNGAVNVNLRSEYARFLLGVTIDIEVAGDKDTYYPVSIKFCGRKELPNIITIWKNLGSKTAVYTGNHSKGTSSMLYRYECRNAGWDGNQTYFKTLVASYSYAPLVAHTEISSKDYGLLIIWLRGGGTTYKISADSPLTYNATDHTKSDIRICYETTNIGSSGAPVNVSPKTEIDNAGIYSNGYFGYGNFYGNATTATTATNATNVPVKQNTNTDAEWPIVWSNQNNTNSVTANQLYKSYNHLTYNPKNKRLTVGGIVDSPRINTKLVVATNTGGATDVGMIVEGSSNKIGFIIGSGNVNRGIYDFTNSKWIFQKDASTTYINDWASIGSSTQPVYFSGGKPVACTYSLNKTVPSDAVFTDRSYASYASYTLPATAGWYRIATTAASVINCVGLFQVIGNISGYHTACTLQAGTSYNTEGATNLAVLSTHHYTNGALSKARIVYKSNSWSGQYAYLEVYNAQNQAITLNVKLVDGTGWTLLTTSTSGSIPSGYTNKEAALENETISSSYFKGNLLGNASTASNSDTLDGVHASGLLTALTSNTTNAVSMTVGGTTKNITAATLKTSLGLGSNAYTSTAYLPLSGGTTTGLITLGASSYENTIKWANSDFDSATARAFMGTQGDWIVRVTYVKDLQGNAITATNSDLRYNRNTLKIGSHWALTSGNWSSYIDLSTYATQAYVDAEIAKAQLAGSNVVIPITDVQVKTSGNFATVVSNNIAKIDLSTYATTENLGNYLPLSGGIMSGVITTAAGNLSGLKFGTSHLTSLNNQLLWQSAEAIRFGSSNWDWNSWAGLKYDHPNKTIYLGLADNSIFNANSAQSGGKVKFPGVAEVYVNRLVISSTEGSVKHLQFSRGSYNYISAPSGGTIVVLPNGASASSSTGMTFTSSGFYPQTSAGYNLGTSSYMWNNVYGNYGKFQKELHSPNIYLKTPTASAAFGQIYVGKEGTTTEGGYSYIKIGNDIAEGSDKNARGYLVIYGTKSGANQILSRVTGSSTVNYYLPTVAAYSVYATSAAAVGGTNKPVYVDANGKVNACTYELNATVPASAVFTDTKNTAGSTNSTSKMYLIGATSQGANPQTYSNSNVYATDGTLTTSGVGKDGYIAYPKDGYYSSSNNAQTGYLCITLPQSWTDTMIKFDVNIFNYLNHTSVTYTISGYMYSPTQQWYNVAAYAVGHHQGGLSNLPVIFGHNGTKCVVYIGTATTTWAYPKIAISNITLGWSHTTTEEWSTGWSFSFVTSLGTYNANVQNTNVGYQSQLLQGKSAADFTEKYSWECTVSKNAWSRLCHVKYALTNAGASYILNVQEHRTSVVYNYTYLINTHHNKQGHLTLLNNSNFAYSGDAEARLVVDTYGNNYFEFRDGTRLSDSWTSATVKCELIPISTGDITKYTSFTSGSSIPSDYAIATTVLHTGKGIPNVDNYWTEQYYKKTRFDRGTENWYGKPQYTIYEFQFEILPKCSYTITLNDSTDFFLQDIYGPGAQLVSNMLVGTILYPKYGIYVDGVLIEQATGNSSNFKIKDLFKNLCITGENNTNSTKTITISLKLDDVIGWDQITAGNYYYPVGSPGVFKVTDRSNCYITTGMYGSVSGAKRLYFDVEITRGGSVKYTEDYTKYTNGFVFSDVTTNSLTYCNSDLFIIKRGDMCWKFNSSGLAQSSNSGQNWSQISGLAAPL